MVYVTSCEDPKDPGRTLAAVDASGRVLARWPNCPSTRAPVLGRDGVLVGVTHDGNLAVLRRNI